MVAFGIFASILFLLMLAVLELNKNTLVGFVLLLAVTAGFVLLFVKVLHGGKWYWKVLGWLGWIAAFAAILFLTWPPVRAVPAYAGKTPVYTGTVSLADGDVRGVLIDDGAVELYAGIPYAKPPVGELRWCEPQDVEPWSGVRDCDHFAPMCMQPTELPIVSSLKQVIGYHDYRISLSDNYVAPVSEDGLYVNVWKPAGDAKDLPVLVYIHGGTLQTGQPWYGDYAGTGLAKRGVVVVNLGYRLGVFGYFADEALQAESAHGTTGNYGLLDQIKALEWVQKNVAAFGGDPDNVTIAGESAGAASVSAICTSPLAKGLFRRALLESSTVASIEPPHSFRSFSDAIASGRQLKERHHVSTAEELRKLDAKAIVNEAYTQHYMTVDGYALTETPYESYRKGVHNEEQLLHGYNAEESGPFILFGHANLKNFEGKVRAYFKEHADDVLAIYAPKTDAEADAAWARIYGAIFFDYPHYCLGQLAKENGIPAYEYYFSKQNGRLSAWHSGELIYLYGNIPAGSRLFDANDRALSETMQKYVVNFVKNGDPNGDGLPAWECGDGTRLLEFGEMTAMRDEQSLALFAVLDRMQGRTAE
jgi:para-nitrobenzyl esterase